MQSITENQRMKEGCFVYQITDDGNVEARSSTSVGDDNRTGIIYAKGDLVSVDLILPSYIKDSTNGPFLRLSDKSGWIFEKKYGATIAKQLPVEKGLWAFYVEKRMSLKGNPTGLRKAYYSTEYEPMQLIYCDRRVISPVTNIASYRVQGTDGWLEEKGDKGDFYLLPENKVKTGLFAYEVVEAPISVYSKPYIDEKTKQPVKSFKVGEIAIFDVIRQSPHNSGNGPFLRLGDGWGWMYERVNAGVADGQMRQLTIEDGFWSLQVVNENGIAMRRHPVDRRDCLLSTTFNPGEIVRCDKRIQSSGRTTFYRVAGKEGWVFDVRGDHVMMRQVSHSRAVSVNSELTDEGWSIEYVRGMAAAFELTEIMLNETSRVISFQTDANERINVYYTTRTVGTALNHPSQGATQLFRRRCSHEELREIMQNPRVHTGKGYRKRSRMEGGYPYDHRSYGEQAEEYIDEELDYRNKLLEYEKEEEKIAKKKLTVLKKLKVFDDKREKDAAKFFTKELNRANEFEEERRKIEEAEERKRCTCGACGQVFVNVHAKNQHYQAVHVFECEYCYKDFNTRHALNQHKNATGHW